MIQRKSTWTISLILLFTITASVFKISHGIPDFCFLEPVVGPCNDRVHMYYFDHVKQTCPFFVFGGCRVNDNVFDSFDNCMDTCTKNATEVTTTTTTPAPTWEELYVRSFKDQPLLVLANATGQSTFTFASPSSYIQIGPQEISNYQIRDRRSVSLEFRTRLPHALLVYHGIKDLPSHLKKYELYIMLDQGQLKVKHLFGDYSTTVVVGKGLNRDKFHRVNVMIDPNTKIIQAFVDNHNISMAIDGLDEIPYYGAGHETLESVIFIGGLEAVHLEEHLDISYLANPFVGCIRNVALARSPTISLPLEPVTGLVASRFHKVEENCINKCSDVSTSCSYDSKCINFYDHVECDCFDARFKGDECRFASIPLLSLYGYSYLTFTVYEWMDRVYSDANRISVHFKTQVDDSILFYAAGEIPYHNHIAATIQEHVLHVSLDFGDVNVEPISVQMGNQITDGSWHVLTIDHQENKVAINLDGHQQDFEIKGNNQHLYIDPDIYIGGGGPRLKNRQGLNSSNNFVGCIKEVYFNEKSVLWELYAKRHQAQYHGLTDPVFKERCDLQVTVPITIPFAESGFRISNPAPEELNLNFEFRTSEVFTTLAYSDIRTLKEEGFWELQIMNDNLQFVLYTGKDRLEGSSSKPLSAKFHRIPGQWSRVELKYLNGEIHLSTDRDHVSEKFAELFQLSPFITLGTSVNKPNTGFVGCIRQIWIGGKHIDARKIVGSDDQIGDIAMDNCQFADPCSRPKVCEHGGKCTFQNGEVTCDCTETGYIGKHCHFAIFKRTCEELALLGYTDSGVYKIDIDGNGPFSPAHVKCKFETDSSGETKTIVEHNLEEHTDIWVPNEKPVDFKLELNYREFSPEMLVSLISQSVQCSQNIKYDCFKAQLSLEQASWFKAADPKSNSIVSIADAERHSCPCYQTRSCASGKVCNCDSMQDKWLSDEGAFSTPDRLGITELYFMAPNNLTKDSASRITLGPLECVEANTQRYVVTFKTFGSYLEAPGWKTGDLAFSFRTTRSSAILLYQPLLHPQHNAFSVFLTNEHELVFQFILNGGPPERVVVRSQRPLSGGDWQQVWIDYDLHQVRFQINAEHQMINLPDGQLFGPFESTMYIAGAPSKHLDEETDNIVEDGLIGCFRGLVMNGQVVDLYSYMKFHKADIVKDCSPSCDPSPCKNKAICQENWGSFTCQCLNPWAQSGQFCENDINVDGLTFLSQSSFRKKAQMNAAADPVRNILTSNIYVNLRTYDEVALVIYANDNLNNFIQIHIEGGTHVIFTWNHGDTIRQLKVAQKALNHGKPIQIAVTRNQSQTTLHVNNENATAFVGLSLLDVYNPMPWSNPELETFSPPRPFASVNTYYQLLLGGYDWNALKPTTGVNIPGMLGCLKGLKVGNDPIKISDLANNNDVLEGCKMVCDTRPCENSGLCIEDFQARTYSCDCAHTSYYGRTCSEEKGGSFHGESFMRRIFKYGDPTVNSIKAHFGFSTSYSDTDTMLLLVSMPNQNYSLLFAINVEGHLMVKEERDGMMFDAVIRYQNFVDGSRHSVYFERTNNETLFIVDQEEIHLSTSIPLTPRALEPVKDATVGQVFVGGVMESVTTFNRFKRFKGCLSNVVVKVGEVETRALEEFFAFRKKEPDAILDVEKHDGIKLGPCAAFSLFRLSPASEDSPQGEITPAVGGSNWVLQSPSKVQIHMRPPAQVESASISDSTLPLICGIFLLCIVLFVAIYAYRINKRYQRRKLEDFDDDDVYFTHRGRPVQYQDPLKSDLQYTAYGRIDPEKATLIKASAPAVNNNERKLNQENSKKATEPEDVSADQGIDDENASSDTSSEGKRSHVSSSSSLSLNATQALDDKNAEPYFVPNGSSSLPNCAPIEEVTESEDTVDDEPRPRPPSLRPIRRNPSPPPIYLSPTMRSVETSPIALIGGQRWEDMRRTSKDSILSLD